MIIQRNEIIEYFRTPLDEIAEIHELPDLRAVLVIRNADGEEVFSKKYCMKKSARLALAALRGKCKYSHYVEVMSARPAESEATA